MKFNYQKFQCARSKTKICFDCFFPLLLKSDEKTIEEIFNFMDEEKN